MYIFKDNIYTKDQLEEIAELKGYTFDELLANNPEIEEEGDGDKKKKKKDSDVEKTQDTAESADVVSETPALETTELQSDATSLDIAPIDLSNIIQDNIVLDEIEEEPVLEKIKRQEL